MHQPRLFSVGRPDPVAASDARDDGIGRADAHADRLWKQQARDAIEWCAAQYETFTADEVWQRLADVGTTLTHEPSALGPIFLWASKHGVVRKTGRVRPTVFARRHRDLTEWAAVR